MTAPQGPRPPGWYDDPNLSGAPRWWDGNQWAPPSQPGQFTPGYGPMFRPQTLIDEAKAGRRAGLALLVGAACQIVSVVTAAIYVHELLDQVNKVLSTSSTTRRGTTPTIALSGSAQAAQGIGQLAGLGSLVVYVIFLVWFHKAASNARDVGIPARRSPGWAIGGWFIPIGNLFLPFQSASDFFPPGHPGRKTVGVWWAAYLGAGFSVLAVYAASFASTGAGLAVAILPAALFVLAALKGRQMIDEALAAHVVMAQHHGLVPPDFDPAAPVAPAGPYGGPGPYGAPGPHGGPGPAPGAFQGPGAPAGQAPRDPWSSS